MNPNQDLEMAVREGGNYFIQSRGEREVICFRYKDYEIITDYNSDHEAYESEIAKTDQDTVLHSVMADFHRGAFNLAVEWLAKELNPQLDFFEE